MPKYHFEIVDGFRLEDPVGLECPSDEQAKTLAQDIARQIAADMTTTSDRDVVVVDAAGSEIYKTAIRSDDRNA